MNKTLSKVQSFIKSCCRLLSSGNADLPKAYVDLKQKVVYGGDVRAPTYKNSFGSLLFSRLMKLKKDKEFAQICSSTKLSLNAERLIQRGVAVARRLEEENVKKGDVVTLIGNNSLNLNVAVSGIFFLGAIPAPMSTRTTYEEFKILLKSVHPKIFLIDRRFIQQVKTVLDEELKSERPKIFLLNEEREEMDEDIEAFSEFIKDRGKDVESFKPAVVEDTENELALVMKALTQGPMGRLVGITHFNINSLIARLDSTPGSVSPRHVILMVQRMSWMSGLYSFFISCCYGAKLVVMNVFEEEKFMEAIEEYKVTATILFGVKVWSLYKHEYSRQYDVSSLRYILSIDGSMPPSLVLGMKEKFGIRLQASYGISELSGLVMLSLTSDKSGSTGRPVLGMYGKVVSEKTNHKVGPNELGILCFKGPTLTKGYINDKKSTQLLFDREGFLVSEMFGYYDEDGYFYVLDKRHNVIRYKNCEISPRELEGIIKGLEEVKDVAVAGIPHPTDGFWPMAIVVLRSKSKLTAHDIMKHVDGLVEDCKKLRGGVIFISKIPRSKESGSVKRYLIGKVLSRYRVFQESSPPESDQPKSKKS